MTDKPQTLVRHIKRGSIYAEIGRGQIQTDLLLSDYAEVVVYRSVDDGRIWIRPTDEFDDASRFERLADAADATTPVVGAEQAGDVRQAWRVKPLDLSNLLKHAFIAGRVSGGCSSSFHSDAWVEYDPTESAAFARITAALEPDPTPALGWKAMQTAAAKVSGNACTRYAGEAYRNDDHRMQNAAKTYAADEIRLAILALPGPTDAQLRDEAVRVIREHNQRILDGYFQNCEICPDVLAVDGEAK